MIIISWIADLNSFLFVHISFHFLYSFLLFSIHSFIYSLKMFSPIMNNYISEQATFVTSNHLRIPTSPSSPSLYSYHLHPDVSTSSSSSSFLATCRRKSHDITGQFKHLIQLSSTTSSSVKFSSSYRRPSLPAILVSIRKQILLKHHSMKREKIDYTHTHIYIE